MLSVETSWLYGSKVVLCCSVKVIKKDGWLGATQDMKNDHYKLLLWEVLPTSSLSSLIFHNHSMLSVL